ncbi:MAG: U32 family peptidase, partial [Oscillospiraceae bacterium]|nr:U32 family peptidase [Oscillospiraceae bacterium]
ANAVYLGCGIFNARQSAKNFTIQTLTEAVKYCHIRGVAVHLTLNTLVADKEMNDAADLIRQAATAGVDAFIVQDLGMVRLCKQVAPEVAIHGSTQLTVHSLSGVQVCAALGMTRVVLSRELSREEIARICAASPIEIEVFAHGALCMCYSGQCYLSAAIGGRSGNRGRCAQPCRQMYGYGRFENKHPLSLKDNCLVHYLRELEAMGVASLKLEGRMKKPEYVATVTSVYRKALDEGNVTRDMEKDLMTAFNRQGFTDGYYTGNTGRSMFGIRTDEREDPKWAAAARQTYEGVENQLVDVGFEVEITKLKTVLQAFDTDGHAVKVEGPLAEIARNHPLDEDSLIQRLSKTGGTPYRCAGVRVKLDPDVILSASAINAMRRDALNQLTALRARHDLPRLGKPGTIRERYGFTGQPQLTVQVTTREQITGRLLNMDTAMLYVPLHILAEDYDLTRKLVSRGGVAVVLPRIIHDGEMEAVIDNLHLLKAQGITEALVSNIGQLLPVREAGLKARGDFGLNIYNSGAILMARDMELQSVTLSFEMTLNQIRHVSKAIPCELMAYGRMPLMVTENCLIKGRTGQCACHLGTTRLTDKTGADFPVIRDGSACRSVLLNGKKLSLLDRQNDLQKLGVWATRLYFTTENMREVDRVLSDYQRPGPFDPGACTRGLYLRGLD